MFTRICIKILTTLTTPSILLSHNYLLIFSQHFRKQTHRLFTQDWLNNYYYCSPLCITLLYFNTISITNIFEVGRSCSRVLESFIWTSILFVYNEHACCVHLRCAFAIHSFPLFLTPLILMCVSVDFVLWSLILKHIRLFSFPLKYERPNSKIFFKKYPYVRTAT